MSYQTPSLFTRYLGAAVFMLTLSGAVWPTLDTPVDTLAVQDARWGVLDPHFAGKVGEVMTLMQARGHRPWIEQSWVAGGSAHGALRDEARAARAADIVPLEALSPSQEMAFYRDLREVAGQVGLASGGWWGVAGESNVAPLGTEPGHLQLDGPPCCSGACAERPRLRRQGTISTRGL